MKRLTKFVPAKLLIKFHASGVRKHLCHRPAGPPRAPVSLPAAATKVRTSVVQDAARECASKKFDRRLRIAWWSRVVVMVGRAL